MCLSFSFFLNKLSYFKINNIFVYCILPSTTIYQYYPSQSDCCCDQLDNQIYGQEISMKRIATNLKIITDDNNLIEHYRNGYLE